ncbi:MAG: hypothetical protein ABW077_16375 [Candidatus Thiodiazotropha endolucinida]
MFTGELDLENGMIRSEHLRQHAVREARGQRPFVYALFLRQLLTLIQRDGDTHLGLDQQVVFCKKPGKQHPVPVLIGTLVNEVVDTMAARARIGPVAELACMGAEPPAQGALRPIHVAIGFMVLYG